MQTVAPIIAAGWIEWAGPVIVFILYTIGQLVMGQGKKPAQQQRVPPKPRSRGPAAATAHLGREAAGRSRGVSPPGERRTAQAGTSSSATRGRQPAAVVVKVEQPVETVIELEPERVSVQEHVKRHISTADVSPACDDSWGRSRSGRRKAAGSFAGEVSTSDWCTSNRGSSNLPSHDAGKAQRPSRSPIYCEAPLACGR